MTLSKVISRFDENYIIDKRNYYLCLHETAKTMTNKENQVEKWKLFFTIFFLIFGLHIEKNNLLHIYRYL